MNLKEISFEIIQKCPNNCIYCSSNSSIKSSDIISFTVFKRVIDDAIKLGLKRLCISGGEPFLHPDIVNMVEYAKKSELEVFIYTSGISINSENISCSLSEDILLKLSDLKIDKLIFNMQAANENLYDLIMGTKGRINILKDSILKTTDKGIFTEIHFVPMKINLDEVEEVIRIAKEYNVKKISFLRFVLQGRALEHEDLLKMSQYDADSLKKTLIKTKNEKKIDIRIGIPLHESYDKIKCNAGWGKLIIRHDGAVFPCEAFKYINCIDNGEILKPDNINNKKLIEIWESSKFLNFLRNEISEFHNKVSDCETCPAQWKIKNLKTH